MEPLPEFLLPLREMKPPFPRAALEEAVRRREESIPFLLQAVEAAADFRREDEAAWAALDSLYLYALFLLAEFREPRAYAPLVRMLRHPEVEELLGDSLFEDAPRLLASVSGGDTGPLRAVFEDLALSEYVRVAALEALGHLVHAGLLPAPDFSAYFGEVFARRELVESSLLVCSIAVGWCAKFRFTEHLETIRALFRDGLVDPMWNTLEAVEEEIALPPGVSMYPLADGRPRGLIDSAAAEMEDWWCFNPKSLEETARLRKLRDSGSPGYRTRDLPQGPFVRSAPKVGRNDPCPCGSGKKYKKCHGAAA